MDILRRRLLFGLLTGGGLVGLLLQMPLRAALAMGRYPQGVRRLEGKVEVNGAAAAVGDIVQIGDTVRTGEGGTVIFVVESMVGRKPPFADAMGHGY